MNKLILLVALPVLLAACASSSTSTTSSSQPKEERVYRTGSNLPVRDPVSSSPTSTVDPSVMRSGTPPRTN